MPPPPGDAQLDSFVKGEIPKLAILYDRFANALDPFSPERDRAEIIFGQEVARLYDDWHDLDSDFRMFRKAIILACRQHLRATDKPTGLAP